MAGDKYIALVSGIKTEKAAIQSSAGAGDVGKIPALDAGGRLDVTMMPTGIGADTAVITASEALSAGDLVNIYDVGAGVFGVRKADGSTTGKQADGFVLAAVSAAAAATVYFEGTNDQVTGLAPGVRYLSATTAGASTSTAPSGAGKIVQQVGVATSATSLNVEFGDWVVLA